MSAAEPTACGVDPVATGVGFDYGPLAVIDGLDLEVATRRAGGLRRTVGLRQVDAARRCSAATSQPTRGTVERAAARAARSTRTAACSRG